MFNFSSLCNWLPSLENVRSHAFDVSLQGLNSLTFTPDQVQRAPATRPEQGLTQEDRTPGAPKGHTQHILSQ